MKIRKIIYLLLSQNPANNTLYSFAQDDTPEFTSEDVNIILTEVGENIACTISGNFIEVNSSNEAIPFIGEFCVPIIESCK